MRKFFKVVVLFIILVGLAIGSAWIYKNFFEETANEEEIEVINEIPETKTVQIFKGDQRPIAVMLDNNKSALPHAGLNKAYMTYEMIVEGGESRLMALFKGVDLEKIGPVRSSRHYFLDYALENDAIYVHYGWSPQAEKDIKSLGINNINGLVDSNPFWRVKDKSAPHNAVTSTEKILEDAENKGYRTTSDADSILQYSVDEVNLEEGENVKSADEVIIPYFNNSNTVKWKYDSEKKEYYRYTRDKQETEESTGEPITAKNIIIEFIKNTTISGDSSGRQTMTTTGNHDGYYITNGKAIKITCSKLSRKSKTEYTDLEGNPIKVNDGQTFVQITPENAKVEIEGAESESEE